MVAEVEGEKSPRFMFHSIVTEEGLFNSPKWLAPLFHFLLNYCFCHSLCIGLHVGCIDLTIAGEQMVRKFLYPFRLWVMQEPLIAMW